MENPIGTPTPPDSNPTDSNPTDSNPASSNPVGPNPRLSGDTRSSRGGPSVLRVLRRRGFLPRPRTLRALRRLSNSLPTRGNDIDLFHDGDRLYSRMLEDIRGAQDRVHLEMYMFLADRTGWRFAHALAERARAGIPVRVIYDSLGSFGNAPDFWEFLRDAGVEVLEFAPVAPWRRRFALFGRDHRKILIVDGKIGYTGGVNIGDPWAGRRRGGDNWRDSHARVSGPAAGDLEVLFIDTWFRESGEVLHLARTVPRETPAAHANQAQVYVVGGSASERRIRRLYLLAVGHARQKIRITCSYFVPDRKFRRALIHARRRRIEVSLLLPKQSDVTVALLASQGLYDRFLRNGIELYEWKPSILHAKTAVVDGEWSTIGSSNLDYLSFHTNLEANLVILDPETGAEIEGRFERDLRFSDRVDLDRWRNRSLWRKLLERVALLFRRWL